MAIELDNLASPADADNFRMTVDWGRWYIDPLPGDDIAPATEDRWPSISAVKKASEKDWSFLVNPRNAALPAAELHRIADLDPTQRLDAFTSHEKVAKQTAFGRGTIIHLWAEDLLAGRAPREITDQYLSANKYPAAALAEAKTYLPALRDFFDAYQPEPVAVEYVTIHRTLNGHGYGGTPDALVRIEGEIVGIDWKTRNGDKPAAYAEELAQIAAGARAEYMVVNDGGQSRRRKLPDIAGGYVVSIHTNGARLYPLDIDLGWQHWCRLHEWWVARLTEKDGIKRVLPFKRATKNAPSPQPAPAEPAATGLDKDELMHRYKVLAAADPVFEEKWKELDIAKGDLEAVAAALTIFERPDNTVEKAARIRANDPKPTPAPADDEGGPADQADVNTCKARFEVGMTGEQKTWIGAVVKEAIAAGVDFRVTIKPTQRRADIYSAITKFVTSDYWESAQFDECVRALLYGATRDEAVLQPGVELGNAIGSMGTTDSGLFRTLVDELLNEKQTFVAHDATGTLRLQPAA